MRYYEVMFIIKANLGEDKTTEVVDGFKNKLEKNEGKVLSLHEIGQREVSETFQNATQGYFVECQFSGTNKTIDEMKRYFHVTENVLRHLVVRLEEILTKEKLEQVIAGAN
ncbi:30S ribosomal protein S6 [bacterium]|jgi:small subunit ribosomal protein S6|nr:30S ribosomal protein S6 [bacterium]